jgi:hypothetical protein
LEPPAQDPAGRNDEEDRKTDYGMFKDGQPLKKKRAVPCA